MTQVLDVDLNEKPLAPGAKFVSPVREFTGNLMDLHGTQVQKKDETEARPVWIVFCTNGVVKQDGEAVMGVGIARRMAEKYPSLKGAVGKAIDRNNGGRNSVLRLKSLNAFTFPHQENWRAAPILSMIGTSMRQLVAIVNTMPEIDEDHPIFVERPGYQPDQTKSIQWERIAPMLASAGADKRFIFVVPATGNGGSESVRDVDLDL